MALGKRKAAKEGSPRITPAKAKNAVAVAKVIGPVVVPVVTPFVVQAAGAVREQLDRRRARKLGVAVDDLGKYTGKGGALHARIAGAAEAIAEMRDRPNDKEFAQSAETTLRQLTAAVRAAERMPTARRKAAHRAVAAELDGLEERLLHRLGV
jgi:Family of unknown function (DUF6474)